MYNSQFFIRSIFIISLSACLFSCTVTGSGKIPSEKTPAIHAIKLYQKYISPVDGQRCRMYPSCSEYSRQAFQKHGFLTGWILTSDRLLRCGRNELTTSAQVVKNGTRYCDDSLSANDWWWYSSESNRVGK